MPRILRYLCAAVVLIAAAGCSYAPILERTENYDFYTGESGAMCTEGGEGAVPDAGLVGPHFGLTLACAFSGATLPREAAQEAVNIADLPRAQVGAEFVAAQVMTTGEFRPEWDEAPVTAWVQAGDEEFELDEFPGPGTWFVVTAPEDDAVVLWVEDEGRAQGVDLRTGERVDPVEAYYLGMDRDTTDDGFAYEDVQFGTPQTGGWIVECFSDRVDFTRAVWLEDRGWAPEGSVYLVVSFWWGTSEGFEDVDWKLDTDKALVVGDGADAASPIDWSESDVSANEEGSNQTVLFEVPADQEEFTVAFTPIGELIEEGEDVFQLYETPDTTEWTAAF
ncbi:hypothetical protein [Glycomyces paridis]|uniref:DUF4352 domain-containing protein n=1 Tax=Glycomyces paridis TaxID=2126555 RepID=A0A4S8PHT1_9ACTN|nr:hypothetical protein [Glycomyces paridis]THV28962.1 hypothetical protein E9998_09390 [Glycomyces paridis]